MAIRNTIFIGFEWVQGLEVPLEIVPTDSALRIDWKKTPTGEVLIRSLEGDGIARDGVQYIVTFTPEQTILLTSGRLIGELVEERSAGERIIGARIIVPVAIPYAEATT